MEIFLKSKSKFYWYDFTVHGELPRVDQRTNETRAEKIAALKLADAIKGGDPLDRKPPTLRENSMDFLDWVKEGRLEADTRRYYRNGWRLLAKTKIAGKCLDQLTKDDIEKLKFPGGPSNGNNALRTLRRMLNRAKEDELIREVPDFALLGPQPEVWTCQLSAAVHLPHHSDGGIRMARMDDEGVAIILQLGKAL